MPRTRVDGSGMTRTDTVSCICEGPFSFAKTPFWLAKYSPVTPGPPVSYVTLQDAELSEERSGIPQLVFASG
jgi:hypothetical protein